MSRKSEAMLLAQRAAIHLFSTDPELVVGGCSDVSEVISAWLKTRGYAAEPVYGAARYGKREWFLHAWMNVEGRRFDPTLWAQGRKRSYQYMVDPEVAKALRCDVEYIIEGEIEALDKVII